MTPMLYSPSGKLRVIFRTISAVTYTTTGCGNIGLPKEWQMLGAVKAITGILPCGWSTGFFAVVSRMRHEKPPAA